MSYRVCFGTATLVPGIITFTSCDRNFIRNICADVVFKENNIGASILKSANGVHTECASY